MATREELAKAQERRARKRKSPPHPRNQYNHAYRLKKVYGLTVEQYAELLAAQDGMCAVCGNKPGKWRLAVEHSHITNTIRGLLCMGCNRQLLGALERDPNTFIEKVGRAIAFLEAARDDYIQYRDNPAEGPTLRHSLVEASGTEGA